MKIPKARRLVSGEYMIQLRLGGQSIVVKDRSLRSCQRKAELVKAQHRNGARVSKATGENMTLLQAIDKYIADRDGVLSPSTIRGYNAIKRNRFAAVMNRQIKTVKSWQAVVNDESKVVSPKTVKNAWGLVHSVLTAAGFSVDSVVTPAQPRYIRPYLDPDEIKPFLSAIRGDKCEMAALLALHSLRRSELLAVDKNDVSGGRIAVRGAIVRGESGMVARDQNKTETSTRIVPIFIPRLQELVDAAPPGKLVSIKPDVICTRLKELAEANNLSPVTLHSLRHSFASLCYSLRLSEMETMRLGGWSDTGTMRKIYTHLAERDKRASEDKLTAFFALE